MSVPAVPTARAAWWHAALVVLVVATIVTLVPLGPWRPAAEIVLFGLGLAGVRTALHRHRTPLVLAWRGLGLGLVFFALSCVADSLALAGILPGPIGAVESGLDIAAYAAMAVGALGVVRGGRRRRDRGSWIDTATLLLAAALALLAVRGDEHSLSADLVEVGIGTPVLTAVLLMVCAPLAMSRGARSVTTMALLAAGVLTIVGYGGRILVGDLRESPLLDPLPLLAVAALVLAGRHPSVAGRGRRPASEKDATASRVLGLGASLLISPALLVLWSIGHGGIGYVLGAGSSLLTAIALWRLMTLNREQERTRAALAASEARLQLLLDNAADVIGIVDSDGSIAYISPAVEALLGRPPAEYLGRNAFELADARDQPRLRTAVAAAGDSGGRGAGFVDTDIRVQHSSGGTRWVEMRISGRVAAVGIDGWVVNIREVTDRKLFEEELRRQATTDPLTGLLNRTAFSERLAAATVTIDPAAPPAVLFVDVDDFKTVNDTLGHAAGDELLVTVAARLTADVRSDDVVARLGGDEFAVLLTVAPGDRLRDVSDRLLTALRAPVELAGTTVSITASIGGALGAPGDTAETLLHGADTAMYSAKRSGKDSRALLDALPRQRSSQALDEPAH
ncbi:sensor domain-containing diguanylate cyclase [Blastococcus mobilis]|uniref:PAS domain S-box-containing protein/diguanylate cyclase (GGDEF) domain-containing protein n=1 Tax=Blastococcus mobilis TaxID=1938746 RepID=A0A238XRS8_9ACTN|nr:sensor domain-containing diguanylate cyclase [Blastococcus mobilis]SNR61143.1 PAS domain S-box-containing protein/diguanylate cyclase (GGDEF) domain-containing protein [Blastococcus mobilis]